MKEHDEVVRKGEGPRGEYKLRGQRSSPTLSRVGTSIMVKGKQWARRMWGGGLEHRGAGIKCYEERHWACLHPMLIYHTVVLSPGRQVNRTASTWKRKWKWNEKAFGSSCFPLCACRKCCLRLHVTTELQGGYKEQCHFGGRNLFTEVTWLVCNPTVRNWQK